MQASGALQNLQVGCQVNQLESQSNDIEVLDDDFTDIQIRVSGGNINCNEDDDDCDEDDEAPKNYGDRRSQGTRGPYNLRAKPRASTKFAETCPTPKKLKTVSSSVASVHTSRSKKITEFKKTENLSLHCVPLKLIQSRLNEALRR